MAYKNKERQKARIRELYREKQAAMPEVRKALLESGHFTPINEDWMKPIVEGLEAGQKMRQLEKENPLLWVALAFGLFVIPAFGQAVVLEEITVVKTTTNITRKLIATNLPPPVPVPVQMQEFHIVPHRLYTNLIVLGSNRVVFACHIESSINGDPPWRIESTMQFAESATNGPRFLRARLEPVYISLLTNIPPPLKER